MAEREWLVAENRSMLFALPRESVREMVPGAQVIPLPFSGRFIQGVFLHGGRAVPVFGNEALGFSGACGDLVVIESGGEPMALGVSRVAGFCRSEVLPAQGEAQPEPFHGEIAFEGRRVAAAEAEDLYKLAGFI